MWNVEHDGKVLKIHREEFMQMVMNEGCLDSIEAAENVIRGVFRALKEQITIGETGDVTAQLPGDMKDLWVQHRKFIPEQELIKDIIIFRA